MSHSWLLLIKSVPGTSSEPDSRDECPLKHRSAVVRVVRGWPVVYPAGALVLVKLLRACSVLTADV